MCRIICPFLPGGRTDVSLTFTCRAFFSGYHAASPWWRWGSLTYEAGRVCCVANTQHRCRSLGKARVMTYQRAIPGSGDSCAWWLWGTGPAGQMSSARRPGAAAALRGGQEFKTRAVSSDWCLESSPGRAAVGGHTRGVRWCPSHDPSREQSDAYKGTHSRFISIKRMPLEGKFNVTNSFEFGNWC